MRCRNSALILGVGTGDQRQGPSSWLGHLPLLRAEFEPGVGDDGS